MSKNKIYVTKPFMPPLSEFNRSLEQIWKSGRLTNKGPFHDKFERALADYLDVPYVSLFSNGTLALITALQALRIRGEVITTPYSFVATTHALWWNRIKPVFVDIEPKYCTLDPEKIEAAITPDTTAILPVHVYGYPCQVERIQKVADKYGLTVIYDAAHTMGAKYNGKSIASYGEMSILSFHATKIFHTFEGGAIVCHDKRIKERIDYLTNFGFENETTVIMPGINSKMSELQAAMGLINLKYIDTLIENRKKAVELYTSFIKNINGLGFINAKNQDYNFAYFPIFTKQAELGMSRDELFYELKDKNILTRRYFYPLITDFKSYKVDNNIFIKARKIADNVICLPLYSDNNYDYVEKVIKSINEIIKKHNV